MNKGIWIFVEQVQGKIRKVSLELLSEGKKIAEQTKEPLIAVILGGKINFLAEEVASYGVDKVILADDAKLSSYTTAHYTSVLTTLITKQKPQAILFGNTAIGKDLAPRLAQRLEVGLASDCTGIENDPVTFLSFRRPIYAGKAFAYVSTKQRPILATIRPNTFEVNIFEGEHRPQIIEYPVEIDSMELKEVVKEIIGTVSKRPSLAEARIIVSGGRGLKGPENFKILEELADTIGAAVGASRAAVDAGWIDHDYQIGQTGKTVAPTLYIACGISGAMQHLAGMGSSRYIVAINQDPEANIFNVSDYGIVGDLFEVVPLLSEEFKKVLQQSGLVLSGK